MIDIKGTGSALLDALQMKAAESSVLYNTSTRVSWSDSQSPSPPVILAEAAFGRGLCLSSTFLTDSPILPWCWELTAGQERSVGREGSSGTAWHSRAAIPGISSMRAQATLSFPCLAGGDRAFRDSREPALPVASESCFHLTGFSG